MAPEVEQVDKLGPATGVGEVNIVIILVAVAVPQYKLLAVKVKVITPAAISAALGLYVQVDNEFAFANVPDPLVDHVTLDALDALEPKVMFTGPFPEHVTTFDPATAVGCSYTVKNFDEVTTPHGEFPVAVSVIVTVPPAISAALGV